MSIIVTTLSSGPEGSSTSSLSSSGQHGEDFVPSSHNLTEIKPSPENEELNVAYAASEAVVALLAVFGNALVAYVFCTNRPIRRYRNYYIFALAIADFLVGLLGIPFAVLATAGWPRNLYGCLFTVSILMVLCTVSILCLVAVSIDRYWATTNPFAYYRHMTTTTAVGIILACWVVGAVIGFLPLFGWYKRGEHKGCFFRDVMDYNYLVFLYFATIIFPALLMACFYGYIYRVVIIKIRQKGNLVPALARPSISAPSRSGSLNSDPRGASHLLHSNPIIVSEKRREAKAAHKLGIIIIFFISSWFPLYTMNCIQAFMPDPTQSIFSDNLWEFAVILSHANSSLNPLLYAYHLKEFRIGMKNALLALFRRLLCRPQGKEEIPLSRAQTLPSLALATTPTSGKGLRVSPNQPSRDLRWLQPTGVQIHHQDDGQGSPNSEQRTTPL